jgi:hypothetical protein
MANSKITWANKESLVTDPTIAEKNKVTDSNMNEIKSVVNENADQVIVSDTEPTSADNEIWVDTSSNATYINSEISNEYGTSQNLGYSQEYINDTYGGISLYSSTSGTTENITLSDNANNYSYIEIFFRERGVYANSIKVRREDIAKISLSVTFTDGTYIYTTTQVASINGNTITFDGTGAKRFAINSAGSLFQNSIITIYKVVGYK